jgi:hypothetical protein
LYNYPFIPNPDKEGQMNLSIRWLWLGMLGGSLLLASGGDTTIQRFIGDVVGHFFSAAVLAVIPIVGYYFLYKKIGEKEITYIFAAAWAYLIIAQLLGT